MFRIIVLVGVAATVAAVFGHFALFGPKKVQGGRQRVVRRFSLWEQFVHLVTLAGFLTLAATGFIAAFGAEARLHGWLWVIHFLAAPVFVLGLVGMTISWAKDGLFEPHDWEWARKAGGYLWGDKHAPADRFNAGQKGYLWAVGLLGLATLVSGLGRVNPLFDVLGQDILYQVHRYGALFFIMAAIVHLYLGTIANPGTLGAMLFGRVSSKWAEDHHPLWWEKIKNKRAG